jgi:ribosomal 50S subunit-recycling heat shock protein
MRLDKWLKTSRLIKRRTVAQEACEGGCVSVNGRTAKPSAAVKEGDTVEVTLGTRTIRVEVLSVEENVRKDDAPAMYREIAR